MRIDLEEGKYSVVNELSNGGGLRALRYGEEWRNLSGDGLILAMYHEIERLQEKVEEYENLAEEFDYYAIIAMKNNEEDSE
ncbi:hypothetical protein ACNA6I_01350 [Rossellomorea sp. FS2]|uniref:hypothetical protein n=1 Tax=Rossellomorea sp. FS2 TaxID=3391447 RepID=UPI003A4E0244